MILSLLGGLALFLYGMHMMSTGLESAAGDRMKTILCKAIHIAAYTINKRNQAHFLQCT